MVCGGCCESSELSEECVVVCHEVWCVVRATQTCGGPLARLRWTEWQAQLLREWRSSGRLIRRAAISMAIPHHLATATQQPTARIENNVPIGSAIGEYSN